MKGALKKRMAMKWYHSNRAVSVMFYILCPCGYSGCDGNDLLRFTSFPLQYYTWILLVQSKKLSWVQSASSHWLEAETFKEISQCSGLSNGVILNYLLKPLSFMHNVEGINQKIPHQLRIQLLTLFKCIILWQIVTFQRAPKITSLSTFCSYL